MWPVWLYKLIHEWIKKKAHKLEWLKNKNFGGAYSHVEIL